MRKFDASIPRKMFWSTDTGNTDFCPDCHGRLERDSQSYLLLVRENGDVQPLIIGNRDGYFCANCPVVVLDYDTFAESAIAGNPSSSGFDLKDSRKNSIVRKMPLKKRLVEGNIFYANNMIIRHFDDLIDQ